MNCAFSQQWYRTFLILPILALAVSGIASAEIEVKDGDYRDLAVLNSGAICTINGQSMLECIVSETRRGINPPADLGTVSSVALGGAHACAIQTGGEIRCWGDNFSQQLEVPPDASPAVAIDAGEAHTCAINTAGRLLCWGLAENNRTLVPDTDTNWSAVATGQRHTCGVRADGGVACWGAEESEVNNIPPDLPPVSQIDADRIFTCALTVEGAIWCWGRGAGIAQIPENGPYSALSVAGNFQDNIICGLDTRGNADCKVNATSQIEPGMAMELEQQARDAGPFSAIDTGVRAFTVFSLNPANGQFEPVGDPERIVTGCGVRQDGSLSCWRSPENVTLDQTGVVPEVVQNFSAQIYSESRVELFWQQRNVLDVAAGIGNAGYEIYRDNEPLVFKQNSRSYIDDGVQPDQNYVYRIRAISQFGTPGPFSERLTVNTGSQDGVSGPDGGYQPVARPGDPANLRALVYGATTVELIWDRATINLKGYEIWNNGEFIVFSTGNSQMLRDLTPDTFNRFNVIAILDDNSIGGLASANAQLGEPTQCFAE